MVESGWPSHWTVHSGHFRPRCTRQVSPPHPYPMSRLPMRRKHPIWAIPYSDLIPLRGRSTTRKHVSCPKRPTSFCIRTYLSEETSVRNLFINTSRVYLDTCPNLAPLCTRASHTCAIRIRTREVRAFLHTIVSRTSLVSIFTWRA